MAIRQEHEARKAQRATHPLPRTRLPLRGLTTETGLVDLQTLHRATTRPRQMTPGNVQMLQRAFGNRAVMGLLPRTSASLSVQAKSMTRSPIRTDIRSLQTTEVVQRGKGALDETRVEAQPKPMTPTIAVEAQKGEKKGKHAAVYLATEDFPLVGMQHHFIDLVAGKKGGVKIRIKSTPKDDVMWPLKGISKSWPITKVAAGQALLKAVDLQSQQGKFKYNKLFPFLWRRMNCASFAEKILKAAGILDASAGTLFKSPSHLVFGTHIKKRGGTITPSPGELEKRVGHYYGPRGPRNKKSEKELAKNLTRAFDWKVSAKEIRRIRKRLKL